MSKKEFYQAQFENCFGKAPKPPLKFKPSPTGIDKTLSESKEDNEA